MTLANDRDKCAHLLRRFGLGASEAELDYYMRDGLNGAIDRLLDYKSTDEGFEFDLDLLQNNKGQVRMPQVVQWWTTRLLTTRRPLQEKMTLFWHDHFATCASKVQGPFVMRDQNEILRSNATGSFRTMLSQVSKDPAMIFWLDNQENVKGHANENFAREVMELFTLGIGHYTEKDVQEGARAFTGWGLSLKPGANKIRRAEFRLLPSKHDTGVKQFLGQQANLDGDDVLNVLCDMPRTAEYITWKIWDWFVYNKPEMETIAPFARRFQASGLDIGALLKDIMKSSDFYSAKATRTMVKNPVDFCVTTMRQMGLGATMAASLKGVTDQSNLPRTALLPAGIAASTMKSMGMWLLYPPDVAGWDNGQAWITSATMVERIAWGDKIFGQAAAGQIKNGAKAGLTVNLRYPSYELFAEDPTPQGAVKKLASLFDAPLKPERIPILVQAATKASEGTITRENANRTAGAVTRLIFATPEFQFA